MRAAPRRPGDRALVDGDGVDPFALLFGNRLDCAVCVGPHDPAVVAAGDETAPVARGDEDGGVGMRLDAALLMRFAEADRAVGQREGGRVAEPCSGDHGLAERERLDCGSQTGIFGQGNSLVRRRLPPRRRARWARRAGVCETGRALPERRRWRRAPRASATRAVRPRDPADR